MGRKRRGTPIHGWLIIDKPSGISSNDVVGHVRRATNAAKVGHGGTLDPFATGLLPLLLNGTTRLMPQLQNQDKGYAAVVRLGQRTDTMDPTGTVVAEQDPSDVADEAIDAAVQDFLGEYSQTVPRYAAARVDGRDLLRAAPQRAAVSDGRSRLSARPRLGADLPRHRSKRPRGVEFVRGGYVDDR